MRRLLIVTACLAIAGCASVAPARVGAPAASIATSAGMSAPVSPPIMASSPVDVGSETPLPLPTPSPGSEGTLPPLPVGGRPTDTASPNNVYDSEGVIDVFATEVEATAQNEAGYCDVAIDPVHDGLTVWWHGPPPADVGALLDRARAAHITPSVRAAAFDHRSLGLAEAKLTRLMPQLGMSEVSVSPDCSGLEVGLVVDRPSAEAAVEAIVGPTVPVHFKEMPLISPLYAVGGTR